MIYGLKYVAKRLLGKDVAGRNFAIYPDDTFLVSYPRSGNTWTRFLIANLVYPDKDVSFLNIERLIPDTSSQSNRAMRRTPRPRLIKIHEYFDHRCSTKKHHQRRHRKRQIAAPQLSQVPICRHPQVHHNQ